MNATEARELTRKALDVEGGKAMEVMAVVHRIIRQAAEQGETGVRDPLDDFKNDLNHRQKSAIYDALRKQGFRLEWSESPDPRDQSYMTINW
jgi:hypothetical protein